MHPFAGGMGHDHLVDEAPFGSDKGIGKAVFVILRVLGDLLGILQVARWMISVAPFAPITATSAVGQA